jgi:hypothetical protein
VQVLPDLKIFAVRLSSKALLNSAPQWLPVFGVNEEANGPFPVLVDNPQNG